MSCFIDEMNAIYNREEENKKILREESKSREFQELERIKGLIFDEFVQGFKNTLFQNNDKYIEENGLKHFKGIMYIEGLHYKGFYIHMNIFSVKEKNTIIGKKYMFENLKIGYKLQLTNYPNLPNFSYAKNTLYGQYLDSFSFYSGDGQKLCDILKKEIPTIVFEKKKHSSTDYTIKFDIYI